MGSIFLRLLPYRQTITRALSPPPSPLEGRLVGSAAWITSVRAVRRSVLPVEFSMSHPIYVIAQIYRHPSCLIKHRWEHTPHWREASKFVLSKHQQVQLLEVGHIYVFITATEADECLTCRQLPFFRTYPPLRNPSQMTGPYGLPSFLAAHYRRSRTYPLRMGPQVTQCPVPFLRATSTVRLPLAPDSTTTRSQPRQRGQGA